FADDQNDRLPGMAAELVRRPVAVIVANGVAIPPVKAATAAIPILFPPVFDRVRPGFVASLSRPGGNIPGAVFTTTDLGAKQLGLLHELVPKAAIIATLGDASSLEPEVELRDTGTEGRP